MNQFNKVVITGGSGFLGRALTEHLLKNAQKDGQHTCEQDLDIVWVSRNSDTQHPYGVRIITYEALNDETVDAQTVIINLAGAGIADQRWSEARKKTLFKSRIEPTQAIVDWLVHCNSTSKPFLLSGSAVGWYGSQGDKPLDENSTAEDDFAHQLCQQWEQKALDARDYCQQVFIIRTGIVLSPTGGMLKKILTPFKLGLGGKLGDGRQYFSWVSLVDWVSAVFWIMTHRESLSQHQHIDSPSDGVEKYVFNLTAPNPVTNAHFTEQLGHALHRPTIFTMPSFVLETVLGEMSTLLLDGQRVMPRQLLANDYAFQHDKIETALGTMLQE